MSRPKPLPLLVIALALVAPACYSPRHVGDGEIVDVRLALDLETSWLHVTPGEKAVLCETRGIPTGQVLAYNPDMTVERGARRPSDGIAVSRLEPTGVSIYDDKVQFIRTPGLEVVAEIPEPEGALFDRETRILPLADGTGYVFVTSKPGPSNVWRLDSTERRFTLAGRTALKGPIRGVAVDNSTGRLLLSGQANRLEVFDVDAMKTETLYELPVDEVSAGLAARGGMAWVGTTNGRLVPFEVETGVVHEPLPLGGTGETFAALSLSGRFMAVAVQQRSTRRPPYATNLRVFFVDGARLMDVATAFMETRDDLVDLEVLESTETVVLSTTWDLLAWRFSK